MTPDDVTKAESLLQTLRRIETDLARAREVPSGRKAVAYIADALHNREIPEATIDSLVDHCRAVLINFYADRAKDCRQSLKQLGVDIAAEG